ncbi:hypothetical protein CEXT_71001 [Caerostris extrusa]|uniref:Uncharacterized protein n=1 Tax=Caerostris extrusa TaxID=172846 RepID=A0AAV4MUP3_CAEEX|nr:hypothetical protein CEXT_71001 [Caerostris extrusa]
MFILKSFAGLGFECSPDYGVQPLREMCRDELIRRSRSKFRFSETRSDSFHAFPLLLTRSFRKERAFVHFDGTNRNGGSQVTPGRLPSEVRLPRVICDFLSKSVRFIDYFPF